MMMSRSKPQSKSDKIRALLKQGVDKQTIMKRLKCSYTLVWTIEQSVKNDASPKVRRNLDRAMHYLKKAIEESK